MPGSTALISPHPYDDCVSRLKLAMGSALVYGRPGLLSHSFWFQARPQIVRRNSFRPCLFVTLAEKGFETEIRCRFGLHPFVMAFLVVWFGGVGYAGLRGISEVSHYGSDSAALLGVSLALAASGIAIVAFGHSMAKGDHDQLLAFVKVHLDVR